MDDLATSLLTTLKRSSISTDVKTAAFNNLKSQIKHQRVPESAQSAIVECVKLAIAAQTSTTLVQAGFSALGHLVKRLTIQDQVGVLYAPRHGLLQVLVDRLGDPKEGYRTAALQAMVDLWPARQTEVERFVRDGAIQGGHARGKEAGMQWVTKMHAEQNLQFKPFVAPMIECLEDADGQVREAAKTNIIELFSTARDAAKADLKKQLIAFNVRRSITAHILSTLGVPNAADFATSTAQHSVPQVTSRPETPAADHGFSKSTATDSGHPPTTDLAPVEPLYVSSQRELEDILRQMHPAFEDKETEDNWKIRESNVVKIRRLLAGNALQEHHAVLVAGIKELLDGILKVVNTLRTTMSTTGCQLVQDLATTLGPALDPMVEILLRGFEKMAASTKHISAQNAMVTVDTVLARVTYHPRLMQHIWLAAQDKNVQPRQFAADWLKTILRKQASNKAQFEHSGGAETAEKTIKKGLNDANPKVRENMRGTYWLFAQTWPSRAETIINSLDPKSRQLLEKDAANPNAGSTASAFTVSVGPAAPPNVRAAGSRQSLKDTIAAQRKASLVAKQRAPERPTSAMSTFSPVRETPAARPTAPTATRGRPPPVTSTTSTGSSVAPQRPAMPASSTSQATLSSAPMRRPRRPDVPRPQTADLYSNRQKLKADTPPRSPVPSPPRNFRSSNLAGSQARPGSAASMRQGTGSGRNSRTNSPRVSPIRSKSRPPPQSNATNARGAAGPLSPLGASSDDNFTMIFPPSTAANGMTFQTMIQADSRQPHLEETQLSTLADDDNFTMIIPMSGSTKLPPLNTQIDLMPTIEDEPTKTMRMPIMQSEALTNALVDTVDLQSTQLATFANTASPTHEDLIVFEDNPAEDELVAPAEISPTRAALEELQASDQNQQFSNGDETHEAKTQAPATQRTRSTSPVKRSLATLPTDTMTDRAEVLKTRRLLASGIDRINARTLDIHGFRKVQELIRAHPQSEELRVDELYLVLLDFLKSIDDDLKVNSVKAHAQKSQALATIRLLRSQGVGRDKGAETLCAMLTASGLYDHKSHLALDLERAIDEVLSSDIHDHTPSLKAVLTLTEHATTNKNSLISSLSGLGKVLAKVSHSEQQLDAQSVQRLGKLARRCFNDMDTDVRRANTQVCVEWHAAMGGEQEPLFWQTLKGVSDAQLNLLAYYMARRQATAVNGA